MKLALVYTTFWCAFVPAGILRAYNRLGDYSYGMYIYAFPVQQTLVQSFPHSDAIFNTLVSLPVTGALAVLSWTFIEKPALRLKSTIAAKLDAKDPVATTQF